MTWSDDLWRFACGDVLCLRDRNRNGMGHLKEVVMMMTEKGSREMSEVRLTWICSTELRALFDPARGKDPSLDILLGCSSSPLMLLLLPRLSSSSSPRSDFLLPLRVSCSRGAGKVNWWPTRDLNCWLNKLAKLGRCASRESFRSKMFGPN